MPGAGCDQFLQIPKSRCLLPNLSSELLRSNRTRRSILIAVFHLGPKGPGLLLLALCNIEISQAQLRSGSRNGNGRFGNDGVIEVYGLGIAIGLVVKAG